jgi:hypothetical protein
MEREAEKQAVTLPALSGQELADISRYLASLARVGGASQKPR